MIQRRAVLPGNGTKGQDKNQSGYQQQEFKNQVSTSTGEGTKRVKQEAKIQDPGNVVNQDTWN